MQVLEKVLRCESNDMLIWVSYKDGKVSGLNWMFGADDIENFSDYRVADEGLTKFFSSEIENLKGNSETELFISAINIYITIKHLITETEESYLDTLANKFIDEMNEKYLEVKGTNIIISEFIVRYEDLLSPHELVRGTSLSNLIN